jgi:hypothetical protein
MPRDQRGVEISFQRVEHRVRSAEVGSNR